jgi:hypothetical protein
LKTHSHLDFGVGNFNSIPRVSNFLSFDPVVSEIHVWVSNFIFFTFQSPVIKGGERKFLKKLKKRK